MATMAELIEMMINEMLDENNGEVKINRSYLAEQVSCVPSQITYVVKTRFSSGNGYIVESKRGGGGQIFIKRVEPITQFGYLRQVIESIGTAISYQQAKGIVDNLIRVGMVSNREGNTLLASISDNALVKVNTNVKNFVRADILRNALIGIAMSE